MTNCAKYVFGGLAVFGLLCIPNSGQAQGGPPTANVNVINGAGNPVPVTAPNPLPVTGTVDTTGTITGDVNANITNDQNSPVPVTAETTKTAWFHVFSFAYISGVDHLTQQCLQNTSDNVIAINNINAIMNQSGITETYFRLDIIGGGQPPQSYFLRAIGQLNTAQIQFLAYAVPGSQICIEPRVAGTTFVNSNSNPVVLSGVMDAAINSP